MIIIIIIIIIIQKITTTTFTHIIHVAPRAHFTLSFILPPSSPVVII